MPTRRATCFNRGMGQKSALGKLQETVVGTVRGVAKDPIGTAKGTVALGRAVAGQVAGQVTRTIRNRMGGGPPRPEPVRPVEPEKQAEVTPADVARVSKQPTATAAPTRKATPTKKAPAARSTPSGKLPAKKAPAKKAPAKEAAKSAAEVVEDTSVTTPVGTTGADVATNPDTTDTDLQQPGTEPLMDPATTKEVAAEAETGARGAETETEKD